MLVGFQHRKPVPTAPRVITLFFGEGAAVSNAAKFSRADAMVACRAKDGKGVTNVVIKKGGQILCQEGPGHSATRQDVYDYCKKKYGSTTVRVRKKQNGKWECRIRY